MPPLSVGDLGNACFFGEEVLINCLHAWNGGSAGRLAPALDSPLTDP